MHRSVVAVDYSGLAVLVTALGTFVVACAGAVVTLRVRKEVRTFNESTAGELAAASETRRVEQIPHDDRTLKEQRHIDEAPQPDPPQGPQR